jgi:hypothetical protein
MPAKPRSEVFDPDEVGIYHCWNRLVQRRYLFGFDLLTGKDYSYRKPWVRDRLKQLAGKLAIDVLDYAILDNHLHVVLRNRPDIVATWSDEEVARRWWYVCPERKNADGSVPEPKPCELGLLMADVDQYRGRLSDISWMMRLLCQPIARRANQEDEVDGRFFAGRFGCERLRTIADVLACSIYVALNLVRAGMAATPEQSEFTSAWDRIRGRWQTTGQEINETKVGTFVGQSPAELADAWLAPVFLNERAEATATGEALQSDGHGAADAANRLPSSVCNPVGWPRISNKGFLPMTLDQYLSLLDGVGRMVCAGKRGFIPPELPPILQRLRLDAGGWLDSLWDLFQSVVTATPAVNTSS